MTEWPDIPGVTAIDGRPRLPRDPKSAARLLAEAIGATHTGAGLPAIVESTARSTRGEAVRLEGLAGWLPLSQVVRWRSGRLIAEPGTDLVDLALRYAAWVSTQPVPESFADQSRTYAKTLVAEATRIAQREPERARPAELDDLTEPIVRDDVEHTAESLLDPELPQRIRRLLGALDRAFLERAPHVRASLLALMGGQHVLLLGPPGTAKSMLARGLCRCFADATYFEYLLSRFTHPDELFGPVSIPGLKAEDYRRLTDGFLPQAQVAFLDEIFKANSAILNSLLTLINERVFHHGRHRDQAPLIGLIGASNELPDPDGGLGALFDRFLVRMLVPPLASPDAFLSVATGNVEELAIADSDRLTPQDLRAVRQASATVEVPPTVSDALIRLWRRAEQGEWMCSDRRWRQAIGLLKLAAAADGRSQVIPLDLLLLEHVLPPDPGRAAEVREALLEQLGTRTVPTHDLRAQWMLLSMDRVAPTALKPLTPVPSPELPWPQRLEARRENCARFLEHHRIAVEQLALDRAGIQEVATAHLWIARLPPQVLANHIEASRELAGMLKVAEAYERGLSTIEAVAGLHLDALPEVSRRIYGYGAVCVLAVGSRQVGLTTAGEREPLPRHVQPNENGLVRPTDDPLFEIPYLQVQPEELLDFLDENLQVEALLKRVRASSGPNLRQALHGMRRYLGRSAIPAPPTLP